MQEQQYILRRKCGTAFYYTHPACMRAQTTYTKVPLAKLLTCDATCTECNEPLLQLRMQDCPLHTDEHPFCGDITCPCYSDREYKWRYVEEPRLRGMISEEEAARIFGGQPDNT